MQNLCLGTECTVSGYWSGEASILLHWTQLMFVSVSDHFANLQKVKDANLCLGTECTVSGYWNSEASILLHWTQLMSVNVSDHFADLQQVKDENLCLGTECTGSGCWSCEASILLHWIQLMFVSVSDHFSNLQQVKDEKLVFGDWMHCFRVLKLWSIYSTPLDTIDVCECFGSFRWPSTGKRCKTCVRAWMHYFGVPKLWNNSIGPKMMFRSVSEHFTNVRHVKRCKSCVSGLNAMFRGTEVVKHLFYFIGHNWCLWVFRIISLTFDR
jgi:acid stress-induced BolA-like protein IbaG/YrbA